MSYSSQVEKDYEVRGWYSSVQEIRHDGGEPGDSLVKVATGVIIRNPFAGQFAADLSALTKPSAAIGHALGERAVALLGDRQVESYGKGGIAGTAGEQEHVRSLRHHACSETLARAGGRRQGVDLVGQQGGCSRDVHRYPARPPRTNSISVPTMTQSPSPFRMARAPDELLICVAVASGPRVHQRVGGKSVADLKAAV